MISDTESRREDVGGDPVTPDVQSYSRWTRMGTALSAPAVWARWRAVGVVGAGRRGCGVVWGGEGRGGGGKRRGKEGVQCGGIEAATLGRGGITL